MIKYSKSKIFWNTSDNVPSKISFDKYKAKMVEDTTNTLKVNFVNYDNVEIASKDKDIKYVWINHNNQDYYYYITGIRKVLSGGYVLNCALDIYTTYVIEFIEKMKKAKQEIEIVRSHKLDDKSGQFDDEKLQEAFIQYEEVISSIYKYQSQEVDGNINWFNNNLLVKNPDYNMNKYYVFNDGENGNYTFIPLIKNNEDVDIQIKDPGQSTPKSRYLYTCNTTGTFTYTKSFEGAPRAIDERLKEYSQYEIDNIVREAYKAGNTVSYSLRSKKGEWNQEDWDHHKYTFTDEKSSPFTYYRIVTGTAQKLPSSFSFKSSSKYGAFVGYHQYVKPYLDNIYLPPLLPGYSSPANRLQAFDNKTQNYRSWASMVRIKIDIFETLDKWGKVQQVKNRKDVLEQMKFSQQWSNKFVGLFYLPNILSISSTIKIKDIEFSGKKQKFLCFDLPAEGINVENFPIFEWDFDSRWWLLNNSNITSKNILKTVGLNYYNNNIDISLRASNFYEGPNKVYLGGLMYFTSNGIMVSKSPLLSLQNSIINYPYQLPSGTDEYKNYVNATKNSIETSYNISKQNAIKDSIFGSLSGVAQITGGLGKAAGGVASGNLGAGISGAAQAFQGSVNMTNSLISGVLGIKQKQAQIRAKYADKNNQLGNNLAPANATDSMWLVYNNRIEQGEVLEVKNLTDNSKKSLSNVITLYGEFYPRIEDINEVWNVKDVNKAGYRYISFAGTYLEKIYYKYSEHIPLEYKEDIIQLLDEGLRFWDKEEPVYAEWEGDLPVSPDNPEIGGEVELPDPVIKEVSVSIWDHLQIPLNLWIEQGTPTTQGFLFNLQQIPGTSQIDFKWFTYNGEWKEKSLDKFSKLTIDLNTQEIDTYSNSSPLSIISIDKKDWDYIKYALKEIEIVNMRREDLRAIKKRLNCIIFVIDWKGLDEEGYKAEIEKVNIKTTINGEVIFN